MIRMDAGEADTIRTIAIFLTTLAVAGFPAAVSKQGRQWSAWFAVIGCEMFMAGSISAIAGHWHTPGIVWYRTPLAILGSFFMILFVMQVFFTPSDTTTRGGTRENHRR